MNQVNVLVTAVGGPTALGVLKCLQNINHLRLIGADSQLHTAGKLFCEQVYHVSRISNVEEYKKEILEIIDVENIDIIFPTLQDEISIFQEMRKTLQAKVALPISVHIDVLIDKEKLYQYLEKTNVKQYIPKYYVFNHNTELKKIVEQYFSKDEYVCVKGVKGHGGLGLAILTNRKNYLQAIKFGNSKVFHIADYFDVESLDRRMAMEYLDGLEYSVDVMLHQGEVVVAVPRKRNRVSDGVVIDGVVEFNQEIIDAASSVAKTIANSGFMNLQFIHSNKGYKLTDVNARFCGSQVMSFGAGVNFPYLFIQYQLLNQKVSVSPKWDTRMVRYWESCFFYD